jgi:hypothetical protein
MITAREWSDKMRAAKLTALEFQVLAIVAACGGCSGEITYHRTGFYEECGRAANATWRALERLRDAGLIRLESVGWEVVN